MKVKKVSLNLMIITVNNKGYEITGTVNPHSLDNVKRFFLVKLALCL